MKTTSELEHNIRSAASPDVLLEQEPDQLSLTSYLHLLLERRGLSVGSVIRQCNLDRSYGYQLFNGTRRPTRDMLVALALQLEFTEEETQRLLKLAGRPVLYARNKRDAALLYSLTHRLTLAQAGELLAGSEVSPLGYGI